MLIKTAASETNYTPCSGHQHTRGYGPCMGIYASNNPLISLYAPYFYLTSTEATML